LVKGTTDWIEQEDFGDSGVGGAKVTDTKRGNLANTSRENGRLDGCKAGKEETEG
jgi:hypothetical protein